MQVRVSRSLRPHSVPRPYLDDLSVEVVWRAPSRGAPLVGRMGATWSYWSRR